MSAANCVRVAVLDDERRLLLLRTRDPGESDALRWELPGGRIEPGEDPREAAKRELLAETGIEVEEVGIRLGVVQTELRQETIYLVDLAATAAPALGRRHRWWPPEEALPRVRVDPPHLARLLQDVR